MRGCFSSVQQGRTSDDLGRRRSTVAQRWSVFVSRWFPECRWEGTGRGGGTLSAGEGGKLNDKNVFAAFCVARVTSTCIIVAHAGRRGYSSRIDTEIVRQTDRHFYILVFPNCIHRRLLQTPSPTVQFHSLRGHLKCCLYKGSPRHVSVQHFIGEIVRTTFAEHTVVSRATTVGGVVVAGGGGGVKVCDTYRE